MQPSSCVGAQKPRRARSCAHIQYSPTMTLKLCLSRHENDLNGTKSRTEASNSTFPITPLAACSEGLFKVCWSEAAPGWTPALTPQQRHACALRQDRRSKRSRHRSRPRQSRLQVKKVLFFLFRCTTQIFSEDDPTNPKTEKKQN